MKCFGFYSEGYDDQARPWGRAGGAAVRGPGSLWAPVGLPRYCMYTFSVSQPNKGTQQRLVSVVCAIRRERDGAVRLSLILFPLHRLRVAGY